MNQFLGFLMPLFICLLVLFLHLFLPSKWFEGYVIDPNTNKKLTYRLNGIWVMLAVLSIWLGLCHFHIIAWDWLYQIRWYAVAGANLFGIILSFVIFIRSRSKTNSPLKDLFLGRELNLQLWNGRLDVKMYLYLTGAVLLQLNVISFLAYHYILFAPNISVGFLLAACLMSFFIFDYVIFERVHVFSYDIFAEKIGLKLVWGCIGFYPFFYLLPLWSTVHIHGEIFSWKIIASILLFIFGWTLSRGANLQKYTFKKYPSRSFLGIKPDTITDGNKRLLVSGFWGLSRHINYLGEILMALGIVFVLNQNDTIVPFIYPLYFVVLLVPRQIEDDKRCALKYGSLWEEYRNLVSSRIIPYIY